MLVESIRLNYPYFTIATYKQQSYVYNTIKIIDYLPTSRKELLFILVDRLLTLDVHTAKEDFLPLVDEQFGKYYVDFKAQFGCKTILSSFRAPYSEFL